MTCARIAAAGGVPLALPLFEVRALAWTPPPAGRFDALILTSANAVRHAGAALDGYRALPVFAVGEATAAAASAAGLTVVVTGNKDAIDLADRMATRGIERALHLAGRDRARADLPGVAETVAVYASEPIVPTPGHLSALAGTVALIHSPRAGAHLAALVPDPVTVRIAAISDAALTAAGTGWASSRVAEYPSDKSLIAAALSLAD